MACHGTGAEGLATSWSHLLWATTVQGLKGCLVLSPCSMIAVTHLGLALLLPTRFGAATWGEGCPMGGVSLWREHFRCLRNPRLPLAAYRPARAELGGSQPARWQPLLTSAVGHLWELGAGYG